jgi:hypothetical protein
LTDVLVTPYTRSGDWWCENCRWFFYEEVTGGKHPLEVEGLTCGLHGTSRLGTRVVGLYISWESTSQVAAFLELSEGGVEQILDEFYAKLDQAEESGGYAARLALLGRAGLLATHGRP